MSIRKTAIAIIGGGAAGIGFGITLEELGFTDYVIIEKNKIGNSFRSWPKETRFITPSFTTNGFGMPDLNAASVKTSPASTLEKERLSGSDYAKYLRLLVRGYNLSLIEDSEVFSILKKGDEYTVKTGQHTYLARYVIMALGEFSFPNYEKITGVEEFGIHYGEIHAFSQFKEETYVIIGGNESALDCAINLILRGKKVRLYSRHSAMDLTDTDPSIRLSPYTRERFFNLIAQDRYQKCFEIIHDTKIVSLSKVDKTYHLETSTGLIISTTTVPIVCTGFKNGALEIAGAFFQVDEKGQVVLNLGDESTIAPNIFIVGPSVNQRDCTFCYIYQFRQRFALVAKEIASREKMNLDQNMLAYYKKEAFYLENCDDCESICEC